MRNRKYNGKDRNRSHSSDKSCEKYAKMNGKREETDLDYVTHFFGE